MNWVFYILTAIFLIVLIIFRYHWAFYIAAAIYPMVQIVLQISADKNLGAQTTIRGKLKSFTPYAAIVAILVGVIIGIKKEQNDQREGASLKSEVSTVNSNQLNLNLNVTEKLQVLSKAIAAKDPAVRLALLDDEEKNNVKEQNELITNRELIAEEPVSLANLRAERENRRLLREKQSEQAEIQRERDEIQNRQAQQEAEQKTQQETVQKEKLLTDQCLSIFDHVIRTLYTTLTGVAKDTGDKLFSDFPTSPPTIYESSLANKGKIINGKNSIRLGTNSAWNFEIFSMELRPIWNSKLPNDRDSVLRYDGVTSLRVACQGKFLTIKPTISDDALNSADPDMGINQVLIRFRTSNGSNSVTQQSYTNYTEAIDEALRALIEAQDEQFPLTILTNK